ncbi:hypothetical protein V1389_14585 [Flavobacterium rakeshii]|uniref:hypothetical protein n=1 Tax=Flavobacterium rakeshii TaxID=1038845 RepID=UPI002E7B4703|nr:hypothetical protein [Flavobacterium rakeshii]MEE1899573.1 hypothetical protein [Flavobacterium rakeshii]
MRSTETKSIAQHLTASHLFGVQPTQNQQETPPLQQPECLKAVYPALTEEAFAKTMDNYRAFVAKYNAQTREENKLIDKHNALAKALTETKEVAKLSNDHIVFIQFFPKRYNDLNTREYNAEIDSQPENLSRLLLKKRIQTIKYPTEQIFQNMLHLYNTQLMKRNSEYMRLGVRTLRPVQELDVNSYFITQLKRNNVHSLNICTKTVRNHRQRLEEAGIFVNAIFSGHTKGVKVQINPEILAIFDLQTNQYATTENQHVTPQERKELPDNNETTGTNKEEYKKKKDATQSFDDKEFPAVTSSLHYKTVFYRNTGSNVKNSPEGGAAQNVKTQKTLSEELRDLIEHPQQLAVNMANGEYNNYIPIDIRLLHKEAYNGTLTRAEFRELVIQDFIKNSAKLYRDTTPFAGSWKNAINHWMQNKFLTYNGIEFNKANVAEDVQQLRWRLEHARKWFNRTGIPPLYPSNYFDITRKTSKEIGFEYTKKAWERHVKYMESQPVKKRQLQRKAEARLKQINHSKKYENEIRRFLKNKISLPQLIDYVQNNLPQDFYIKLPQTLKQLEITFKP